MAKILKKPYIETVLETFADTDLELLRTKINSSKDLVIPTVILGNSNFPLDKSRWSNKNIAEIYLEDIKRFGILCWNSSKCVVLAPEPGEDTIEIFEISGTTVTRISETFTGEEIRRIIDDAEESSGGKDAWVAEMKTKIYVDSNDTVQQTEPTEMQEDVVFDGKIKVVNRSKFVDHDGTSISFASVYKHEVYFTKDTNKYFFVFTSNAPAQLTTKAAVLTAARSAIGVTYYDADDDTVIYDNIICINTSGKGIAVNSDTAAVTYILISDLTFVSDTVTTIAL